MASSTAVQAAGAAAVDAAGHPKTSVGGATIDQQLTPWFKRWVLLAVCVLTGVTAVTPFLEDMPASHRQVVPLASLAIFAAWLLDLWVARVSSRRLLIAAALLANLWLTAIGHISNNYLLLTLLVAWVGVSGPWADGVAALALSLVLFAFSAVLGVTAPGQVAWAALTSWSAGAVGVWLMARLFVRQGRLVAELQRLAMENADLSAQAQQAAILEERQRLARELHDSVTQALYGISLQAEAGVRALAEGEPQPASSSLQEIRETTREAQAEMRLLLYELRPPILEEQGLAAALEARLRTVEARAGLGVNFDRQGEGSLPPAAEQEFYRIAQEALNNVVKHAHASQVDVRLTVANDRAILEIVDDGLGFSPQSAAGGYGLQGMRERAERLGGKLAVESVPGGGTRIRVEVTR